MKAVIKRRAKWQPDWYLGVAWERAGMPSIGSPGVVRTEYNVMELDTLW